MSDEFQECSTSKHKSIYSVNLMKSNNQQESRGSQRLKDQLLLWQVGSSYKDVSEFSVFNSVICWPVSSERLTVICWLVSSAEEAGHNTVQLECCLF